MKGSCMYTVSMLFLYTVGFSTWQVGGGRPVGWLVEALPWVRWGCFNFTKFQNHRSHVQKYLSQLHSRKFQQFKKHSLLLNDLYLECIFHCHRSSERKMLPTCTVPPLFSSNSNVRRRASSRVEATVEACNNDMLDHFCPSFNVW